VQLRPITHAQSPVLSRPEKARTDAWYDRYMVLYDARPLRAAGQVVLDVVLVGGVVLAILLGRAVSHSVAALADVGARVQEQGSAFGDQLRRAATALGDVPLVGDQVAAPLRDASGTAARIAAAGSEQQRATLQLAHLLGTSLAIVVIVVVVVLWLRYRAAFIRSASSTARLGRLPAGREVLALRALVSRDAAAGLGADVVQRWRDRDEATVEALADLEYRSSGLRRSSRPGR
jgi:hypothetical protein